MTNPKPWTSALLYWDQFPTLEAEIPKDPTDSIYIHQSEFRNKKKIAVGKGAIFGSKQLISLAHGTDDFVDIHYVDGSDGYDEPSEDTFPVDVEFLRAIATNWGIFGGYFMYGEWYEDTRSTLHIY